MIRTNKIITFLIFSYFHSIMRFKENSLPEREFCVKLHLKTDIARTMSDECDIGFQVQFNAEFPPQVMNFPVVFFGEVIEIQSMKGLVSANAFC